MYHKKLYILLILLTGGVSIMVSGCSSISLEKKLTLIRNNEPLYAIIYSNTPSATEMTAVNELSYYIKKITGVDSRKIAEKNANEADKSNAIYIGNTDFARVRGIIPETLGEEEWIIRFFDEAVVIAGGQPRGALYGIYAFMQKYMGIYVLDPYTEVVPKSQDLYIKKANMTGKPKFVIRRVHTGRNNINGDERFYSFNMATPLFGFSEVKASGGSFHTFGNYISQEEYASSHPEYFSMNPQGQRDTKGYYQLCLTNADVRRIFLEKLLSNITSDRAKAKIAGADYPRMYDICQNDFTKYLCCCDECKAVSDREGSESGLLLEFINELADGVRNVYPDVLIRTLAYNFTLRAPEKIRPRENVVIYYCINYGRRNYPLPLMDESNSEFQNDIDTWSEITAHMFIWEYGRMYHLHDPGFYIPSSNIGNIQKDLQYLRNRNVSYIFVQNEEFYPDPHPFKDDFHSFHPLRTWLYYQMMQDPDQNVEPLLKAFFEGYYGPAAEKMRQYLDYLEMRQQTYEGGLSLNDMGVAKLENGVRIGRKNYYKAYLDLNFFITADRLLREAEKLVAGDDYYRIRVTREFIPVYSALLNLQPLLQEAYCTKDAGFPFDRKDILTRYENIWDTYLDYPVFSTLKQEMAPFIQYRIDLLKKATGQTSEWNDPNLD